MRQFMRAQNECSFCFGRDSKRVKGKEVGRGFSSRYFYIDYQCPKCGNKWSEGRRWRATNWQHFRVNCEKCGETGKQVEIRGYGRLIYQDYECPKCGHKWSNEIETYF